jgi:hypothetical protein
MNKIDQGRRRFATATDSVAAATSKVAPGEMFRAMTRTVFVVQAVASSSMNRVELDQRRLGQIPLPGSGDRHIGQCRRPARQRRQVPGHLRLELARANGHRGAGVEQRRRRLRQPEQPQRFELDLPIQADDPDLREGDAGTDRDRLTSVQRGVGYRRLGVQRQLSRVIGPQARRGQYVALRVQQIALFRRRQLPVMLL